MNRIVWLLLLAMMGVPGSCLAGGFVLIAHPSVQEDSLSQKDVQNIFLSKKKSLAGGSIKLVIQKDRSLQEMFLKTYVKKTISQYKSYYKKLVFTGKGKAPKAVADDSAMMSYVANTPGAIGYVNKETQSDKVKVITVQ